MIGSSLAEPTAAQLLRWDAIRDLGCLACRLRYPEIQATPCEVHHLTIGGKHGQKRRGHEASIGLCTWHHRGEVTDARTARFEVWLGPSYAKQPTAFREIFGDDEFLLDAQNQLLARHRQLTSIRPVLA